MNSPLFANSSFPSGVIMPLDHLGLIEVSGNDAADFLHNQLTNDVLSLNPEAARLAGYCSPKGRLQATFLMWKEEQGIYLQCSKDIQVGIQKRLTMFVLRAKAKLIDASETLAQMGLAGPACKPFLQNHFDVLPENNWEKRTGSSGSLIRVPDSMQQPRWLWIMPAEQLDTLKAQVQVQVQVQAQASLTWADPEVWRWLEIRAGLPCITGATQDRFVPQMINLEALDGVNFKKGCYPGQEVVARSQYLGKLKRRTAVAQLSGEDLQSGSLPAAGEDVFDPAHPAEPIGTIVNAAPSPLGSADLLVELPQALLSEGSAHAGLVTAGRKAITLLPLPYVLPDQDIFVRPKL